MRLIDPLFNSQNLVFHCGCCQRSWEVLAAHSWALFKTVSASASAPLRAFNLCELRAVSACPLRLSSEVW